jgi:hypothetical protein
VFDMVVYIKLHACGRAPAGYPPKFKGDIGDHCAGRELPEGALKINTLV